jgi:hypothetical protein
MVEVVHAYSNQHGQAMYLQQMYEIASSMRRPRQQAASRQGQVRLDLPQVNDLIKGYRAGASAKVLAASFGIHRITVTAILQRQGVDLRRRGLCGAQVAEACRLYPNGWSLARLAERYGVDDMTVRRYLLQAGVVMRSPHEDR